MAKAQKYGGPPPSTEQRKPGAGDEYPSGTLIAKPHFMKIKGGYFCWPCLKYAQDYRESKRTSGISQRCPIGFGVTPWEAWVDYDDRRARKLAGM